MKNFQHGLDLLISHLTDFFRCSLTSCKEILEHTTLYKDFYTCEMGALLKPIFVELETIFFSVKSCRSIGG